MADDKIQLVNKNELNDMAVDGPPPQYTPVPQQQAMVLNQYGQPVVHQPAMQYAQPAPQYPQPVQYSQPVMQQPGQQQTVVVSQATPQTVVIQAPTHPPTYMWLACLVFWCCNPLFGGIAFILSLVSSGAADDNRTEDARKLGKASLWTSVIGIVLGVVVISVAIGLVVKATRDVEDDLNDNLKESLHELNNDLNRDNNNWN